MIGIVIVSHGQLGAALVESAEMILDRKENVFTVSVSSISAQVDKMRDDLLRIIDQANEGDGVVILTDLFGGTPSNLSISTLGIRNVEVVAGVNLPMVLKLLSLRERCPGISPSDACVLAEEAGKKQISIASLVAC
ncbi:MAG: PTS mannose transporter subunit IID [Holosporales bacterium]|jgi:PTS system mannose-specific IIA component|nr:PTS mannose transporter subunit IID [Holosporales bacterium]